MIVNLVQIQEHLKDLPTQAIMSYANGQNPQVPPYMALSELNRRKSMEQRAAQKPTTSVKDQLEAEVKQHQNLPQGLPQMPQGPQGIAQLPSAQSALQAEGQGLPQALPQAPQEQQAPQEPQVMAHGGVANLPVDDKMFHYAPGGIVAFANEENKQVVPEEETGDATYSGPSGRLAVPAASPGLQSLMPQASSIIAKAIRGDTDVPTPRNPEDIRKEVMDKYPELAGLVNTIPGADLKKLSDQLQAQNAESKAKFQEGQGRMGLAGLSQALIAAGQATRGHKGMGLGEALGGFGTSYNNFTAEDIKRQQAQQALERQQSIEVAKLNADIATLQQAYAKAQIEGRVSDAAAYQKAISDRAAQIQSIQLGAAEKTGTMVNAEKTLEAQISHNKATEAQQTAQLAAQKANWQAQNEWHQEQIKALKESKPPAEQKLIGMAEKEVERDTQYKDVIKKMEMFTSPVQMQSPEFLYLQETANSIRDSAYQRHKLPPPPRFTMPPVEGFVKPKEQGFISKWWNGDQSAAAPKVIKLD
jgi:hypothetical protein